MPHPIERLTRAYAFLALLVLYLVFPFNLLSAHPRPHPRATPVHPVLANTPASTAEGEREDHRGEHGRALLAELARDATRHYDPLFTGWLHNVVGMNCESWEEWMRRWLAAHGKGRACRVEEAYWGRQWTWDRWYWPSGHVALRVTLCDGGAYYLDPWRFGPNRPAAAAAAYESRFGAPDFTASFAIGSSLADARSPR